MHQVVLKHALLSKPRAADFELTESPDAVCLENGILVRVKYISLDPYIGTRICGNHMGETPPRPGIEPIPGAIVGEVIESRTRRAKVGDHVHSMKGSWQELVIVQVGDFTIVDPEAIPVSAYLGVLGMPGLTAWAGVTQLAKVREGDVFLVDAAAGPVGGTAGQIARHKGAGTVIGIAGGSRKCRLVKKTYGFDACLDYKKQGWQEELKVHAPYGISVHFENVGSDILALAMQNMQPYGRTVLCGLAAHYHVEGPPAMTSIGIIVGKRASLHGLVVYDYYDRWNEFRVEMVPLVQSGQIQYIEDKVRGLDQAPHLMEKLVNGHNIGKCVVAL